MAPPGIPLPKDVPKARHQMRTESPPGAQAGINTLLPTSTFPAQTFSFFPPFFPCWGQNFRCLGGLEAKLLILPGAAAGWAGPAGRWASC